jgi:hypothetical protein
MKDWGETVDAETQTEHLLRAVARLREENERLTEALEWILHQCGASACDDAIAAMNEAYDTAMNALGSSARHAAADTDAILSPEAKRFRAALIDILSGQFDAAGMVAVAREAICGP